MLQAGLRCETVRWTRVQHLMTIPVAATTSGFPAVLRERGGGEVMHWTHAEKLGRLEAVSSNGLSPKSTVQKVHIAASDKLLTFYGLDAAP